MTIPNLTIDTSARTASRDGTTIRLSKARTRLLDALLGSDSTTASDLSTRLQGDPDAIKPLSLRVQICNLRKIIAPLGLGIRCNRLKGYALIDTGGGNADQA